MFIRTIAISLFAGALAVSAGPLFAADQVRDRTQDQTQAQDQERIYGSQLMTQQERMGYCNKQAGDRKGDDRKKFMSSCLSG